MTLFHLRRKNRRTSDDLLNKEEESQQPETESSAAADSGHQTDRNNNNNNNNNKHNHSKLRNSWILHPRRRRRPPNTGLSASHDRPINQQGECHQKGAAAGSKTARKTKTSPGSPSASSDQAAHSAATSVSTSSLMSHQQNPVPSPVSAVVQEAHQIYVEEEKDPAVQAALRHRYRCPCKGPDGSCACPKEEDDGDEEETRNSLTKAVTALDRSGNDYFAAGKYQGALLRYERALVLKRTTLNAAAAEDGGGGGGSTALSSSAPSSADHTSTASSSHSDAGVVKSRRGGDAPANQRSSIMASMATSINNMTYLKQRAGLATTEESLASYLKSLQMKREILGPDHLSVGKTLNNIGSVFYLKKEYEPALSAYKDARRIMEEKLGPDHCDVGTVMSNIGDVHYATHQKEEALAHYRGALDIRWDKLGSKDPKVIRLMKQIASLETGKQPIKDDDEVSLSENWGDDFQGSLDQQGSEVFMASVHNLAAELEEDMKYFDLVERDMAISMVKDKMKIFKEMRELYSTENSENVEGGEGDHVVDWTVDAAAKTEVNFPETLDQSDESETENNVPLSPSRELQVEVENQKQPGSQPNGEGPHTETAAQQHQRQQDTTKPAPAAASTCGEEDQPRESEQTRSEAEEGPTESAMASTAQQDLSESELTPVPSRTGSEAHLKAHHSASASPSPCLSVEERKNALATVRNRLARLRAERSSFSESTADGDGNVIVQVAPPLYEAKKRSYMFPTVSSAAKQVASEEAVDV